MALETQRRVRVGVDRRLGACAPEVQYALSTLLEIAGLTHDMIWVDAEGDGVEALDLYYGASPGSVAQTRGPSAAAPVRIAWNGLSFADAAGYEPRSMRLVDGVPILEFTDALPEGPLQQGGGLYLPSDAIFAAYWWLTGAAEAGYRRDRWGNLHLAGRFFGDFDLASRPGVSLLAAMLRAHFEKQGFEARRPAWSSASGGYGLALSHDVDYPEMIRWIEALRLLRARGLRGFAAWPALAASRNHFWKFQDWVDLARSLGTRPAFYFMARRGSLARFAMGDPDAFYRIDSRRFRALFRQLRDDGCEIGLHASYRACEEPERFALEKARLEEVSGGEVVGNRHHYWRLHPERPNDTLRDHEGAGFEYDASLAFEFYPGFRRGVCHPFRPFHPGERRPLDLVELPPTWMDDHYDSRLVRNGIRDARSDALELVRAAQRTGGIVLVDYHVRGMNRDWFPSWGAWLERLLARDLPTGAKPSTPVELARSAREHAALIDAASTVLPELPGASQ